MPKGVIKFFNESRGYGFIEQGAPEQVQVFVHHTQIADDGYRTLKEGEEVEFDIRDGRRGPEAVNVHKMS